VLVHLPYESFRPVVELVEAAADDPNVLAVKQTLYRTQPDSPIIAALERAALSGKQVAALVELKARFDEAQNIAWAKRLSEAGAQVVYGVVGLKTHAKILLVVRREPDGVRRYVHLSTATTTCRPPPATRTWAVHLRRGSARTRPTSSTRSPATANRASAPAGGGAHRAARRLRQHIAREISRSSKEDPG
jgi:hypothetical protein